MSDFDFDNDLPVVNHTRIPIGIGHVLKWGFGEVSTPENLSGRAAVVVINPGKADQSRHTISTDTDYATLQVDTLNWDTGLLHYALLIAVSAGSSTMQGRARGALSTGLRVTP